jgi:hypothetical protein
MALFFNYGGSDLGTVAVRLGQISGLQECADNGNYGSCGITIDDPAGALNLVGLKKFYVLESTCSEPRLFSGYAAMRRVARGRDSFRTGAARTWDVDLIDLNGIFGQRLLLSNASNRPSETDATRINWILENGWTPELHDNGLVNTSSPVTLDAADYRGRYAGEVLNDCVGARGATRIYFAYWDSAKNQASLAYIDPAGSSFSSTLRFTNVLADVDNSTTFAATGELVRDPSQVYSTIWVPWTGGFSSATNSATAAAFIPRDVAVPAPQIGRATTAQHYADLLATQDNAEQDTITVSVRLPAASVNLIRAGQRVQVKFSHLPGYSAAYTYLRCVRRTVKQDEETTDYYNLDLELSTPRISGATGGSPLPSPPPPFVPSGSTDYPSMVRADGAIHAWAFNTADAAGSTVADYIDSDPGTTTKTGTNPTLAAGPASISSGANNWHVQRTDTNGTVAVVSSTLAADWPSGNSDWSVEYWGDYITTFLDAAFIMRWGNIHTMTLQIGGSPTNVTVSPPTGITISTTTGSTDVSAYTGVGWHNFIFTYVGSTRIVTLYIDGINRWTGTVSADLNIDVPNAATNDYIWQFVALQDYRHGWQSIYPLALSQAQATQHALGDAGAASSSTTVPLIGQAVGAESATGDGTTTAFTSNFPYSTGSLEVHVDGELQVVTQTTPASGIFTFAAAPVNGAIIVWTYNASSPTATGATHPAPTAALAAGPRTILHLTNKSGGSVAAGDVVIVDTTNNDAFTTTTSAAVTKVVGIAQATIASNAIGPVAIEGYVPLVNTTASVTRGNYLETSTTVKKAVDNATRHAGSFAQILTGGTTPDAILFGVPDSGSGGGLTSPLTTKGDLWGFSSVDARIPIGSDTQVLTADSAQTLGLKWAAAPGGGVTVQYPGLKPGTPTYDFAGASLPGAFSAHSSGGSFGTGNCMTQGEAWVGSSLEMQFSEQMGALYVTHADADLDFSVGGIRFSGDPGSSSVMVGIAALNSSGTGIGVTIYNDGGAYFAAITTWSYASNSDSWGNHGATAAGGTTLNGDWWLRLKRVSGTWTGYISQSGRAWDKVFSTRADAVTVDRLAFGLMYNSATVYSMRVIADYFQVDV